MADTSFARKFISAADENEEAAPWRRAFILEREGTVHSFSVSVSFRDGRYVDGFAGSLGARIISLDDGGKVERVILVFSNGGIYIEGQYLKRGIDAARDGKLKCIQQQDGAEISLIRRHNADVAKKEDKEPLVSCVVISPALKTLLERDENLAEIAKILKGEQGETRDAE